MKSRAAKNSLVLLLLGALPTVGVFAGEGSAEPPFRYYSTVDGLTQSGVYDIEQDSLGYLWFTTARGLNRYDGRDFVHYTIVDGLPTNNLTALYIEPDNTVWVGDTSGGVSVIRGSHVLRIIEPPGEGKTPIIDIAMIEDRVFVLAEGAGILEVMAEGEDYRLEAVGGQSIGASNIAAYGSDIWVAADSGMYRLRLSPTPELQLFAEGITHMHTAADGTLWVADRDKRVGTWENGGLVVRAIIDAPDDLISVTTGPDNKTWIATERELFSFDNTQAGRVHTRETMRKYDGIDDVLSLFVDREGTLWLSSESRLIRFLGDRFRHFRLETETDSETVWAISEDNEGRMWFGTQTKLLRREADESLTRVGLNHGIPRGPVRGVVRGASGDMWAGIREKGLYRVSTSTLQARLISGTKGLEILDVAAANDGAIWFSTFASGVFRYSPGDDSIERFPAPENSSVYTLDIWEDNSVYYGADDVGLVHLIPQANGRFEQRIIKSKPSLPNSSFNQIHLIAKNELWVATEEGGLYRFDSDRFTDFGSTTPWADQTVYLVEVLGNGSVVVGGEQGLYQFRPGSRRVTHYNQLSGFMGTETNVHATFIDSRNDLWIGTVDGATRMDASLPMPPYIKPTPQIVSIHTEPGRLPVAENADLDPHQRGVHINYAAVSLLNPRDIEYSYKLVGVEKEWNAATKNHSINYSRIPPGSYEFKVKARYVGDQWSNSTSAGRRFTVLPFFWQKPLFKLFVSVLILLVLWAATAYRTRSIKRLNEVLRAQIEDRTKSIEQAKQSLQLTNEQLSREINERQKADKARADVELRFSRAFDNAPIGMGLLDAEGQIFDTNPVLRNMFWPTAETESKVCFLDRMDNDNQARFLCQFEKLMESDIESLEEKLTCVSTDGEVLRIAIHMSAVRTDAGDFQYAVLQVQDETESQKLTGLLEYQASYDELTGLLNRRSFESRLEQAWENSKTRGTKHYLMYMDLDQFKVVNDTSGHTAGDQLLRNVSEVLLSTVRANDAVCRLGGDEFGIILWNCSTAVARGIAESIRSGIEDLRFQWDSEIYHIGASIGGLPIDPTVGDASELQQLADAACYAAKEEGRNRVHMVSGDGDSARVRRGQVRWVQRLREAMDNNRFVMYGQVIMPVDENVHEPEHIEILLRLRDAKTRKLIPPGAFLPAAERYGMSIELDRWVVSSLLDTLFVHQTFQAEYRRYWINLSGTSVGDTRFARFLVDAVKRSPLPPGTINFEITETAVIRSVVEAGKLMSELREMGCHFALDDFGSGLSSFGYLKKLPVDILKIDGMFIRDILNDETDRIFVKSIIDIAHALNIKTVAEFVEDEEMLGMMKILGSDYVQGFAIGRPFALAPHFPAYSDGDQASDLGRQKAG